MDLFEGAGLSNLGQFGGLKGLIAGKKHRLQHCFQCRRQLGLSKGGLFNVFVKALFDCRLGRLFGSIRLFSGGICFRRNSGFRRLAFILLGHICFHTNGSVSFLLICILTFSSRFFNSRARIFKTNRSELE